MSHMTYGSRGELMELTETESSGREPIKKKGPAMAHPAAMPPPLH